MNHTEMPLANLIGHGDVGAYSLDQEREFCRKSGLHVEKLERGRKFRMHLVARKRELMPKSKGRSISAPALVRDGRMNMQRNEERH